MPARSLALILVLPVVAGCLAGLPGDDAADAVSDVLAAATLACFGDVCNFEATVDPETRQANELSIAVNPTNPLNIVATGKDYTPDHAGDCVWDGIYVTHDGGKTWANSNLPDSPGQRTQGNADPEGTFTRYWCATDPVVRFGPDGTLYWTVMPYQCDAVTGSKTGRDVLPYGGFNDWLWSCSSMYVLVSEDGGDTWGKVREVAFAERLVHDKQWIAASPDGKTVLLCWDLGGEKAYLTESADEAEPVVDRYGVVCSVSRDKGDTWSDYRHIGHDGVLIPMIDFGPDGTAWMTALSGPALDDVVVLSSEDGVTWSEPVVMGKAQWPPAGGKYGWPVLDGSDFRVLPLPALAVDRSDGPFSGRVYVTWFTHAPGNGDIMLSWSDDGATWSEPVRVHDDGDSPHDQFLPALSVGPDGIVDVSWYDRRDDPENHVFHMYHTYSVDGGVTFAPNLKVTDVASDEQYSRHQNGDEFMGDYRDSASTEGAAHIVWTDTRHEKADVFVATILRG